MYDVWLNFDGGGSDQGQFKTLDEALDFARDRGGSYNVQITKNNQMPGIALACDSYNFKHWYISEWQPADQDYISKYLG